MTEIDHLYTVATEECAELIQALSKSMRFGPDNHHPEKPMITNEYQIWEEYYQLQAIMDMLVESGELHPTPLSTINTIKESKQQAIIKYTDISKACGRITDS